MDLAVWRRGACIGTMLACLQGLALAADEPVADERTALSPDMLRSAQQLGRESPGRPYAIVDKRSASLAVFGVDGRLRGVSPVLIGLARGDRGFPAAHQKLTSGGLPAHERTTPAGRFDSVPGRNLNQERVIWFDYGAALAIHRLRPGSAAERRPQRLASPDPTDNRITLGCVVVPPAFFDEVVVPVFGHARGTVLILPEDPAVAAESSL